jgi:hypothetical protein
MEIPFLKNKQNKLGTGMATVSASTSEHTSDQALIDSVADELLEAIEKKDIKALRQALQALVLSIKDHDAAE